MNRKNFIKGSTFTLSLATLPLTGYKLQAAEKQKTTMVYDFDLDEMTIDKLQHKMQDGTLSARAITEKYLKRIEAIDKNGIALKAVITLNPNALKEAEARDIERKDGKVRSALHGIPVLIKDNIETAGIETTAGSMALADYKPAKDAPLVQNLREAGAVILGKTNLSEWANIRSSKSSSGWSSRGGQTKNPYILDRSPVGSSSGSAVAVAANLCVVAVGTETDGSVVAPASGNGIVGIKPTVGLISGEGIVPISKTQDTAGAMARTVSDAAILLGALIDTSAKLPAADFMLSLKSDALKGKIIGVERNWKSINTAINKLYQSTLDELERAGATLVDVELLKEVDKTGDAELEVLLTEFKDGLNQFLIKRDVQVRSLKDVIAFNKKHDGTVMRFFKQEFFETAEKTNGLTSTEYLAALETCRNAVKIIDETFEKNKLDAMCGITLGPVCSTDLLYGDRWGDVNFATPAAIAGYPHITLPCGFIYNLPVGLSFFGKAWSEPKLLGMAYAYEQLTRARKKPAFLQTFDENG